MKAAYFLVSMAMATVDPTPSTDSQSGVLGLAEMPAYHEALRDRDTRTTSAVVFRDLWNQPGRFEGHRVRVDGRVVRRFLTGAVGTLPARTEAWISDGDGNILCLVYPTPLAAASDPARIGVSIEFEGTYLLRIRYMAQDERLAPLIVGAFGPKLLASNQGHAAAPSFGFNVSWMDTGLVVVLGLIAASVLVGRWRSRPVSRSIEADPPILFMDDPGSGSSTDSPARL